MKHEARRLAAGAVLLAALLATAAQAEVRLPSVFGSHMVLQRDRDIPVWGWAAPGEEVRVQLGDTPAIPGKAGADGKWRVTLPPAPAGGPFTMTIAGANELTLEDVLVGEVWVCSGQSNMEWPLAACVNAEQEIAQADYPRMRQIKTPHVPAGFPAEDFVGQWQVCTPQTAGGFTGVGYFFARTSSKS